eukprot:2182685-Amphidinium_carterae.1
MSRLLSECSLSAPLEEMHGQRRERPHSLISDRGPAVQPRLDNRMLQDGMVASDAQHLATIQEHAPP